MTEQLQADVIVPVYRDTGMTLRCLASVLEHGGPTLRRLIVVDDRSPEPDMAAELDRLANADPRVMLLRNGENLGFVASCNRGLAERGGDAVLLNSDTLTTSGWLRELAEVAHADERTACASPLSNNASICSVPEFCGETPAGRVDEDAVRAACAELPRSTIVPTGVGFCLYLRGEVLDLVGDLDPIFGLGYNEENDWSMRAQAMGFVARRANRAFVYHFGSVSFQGLQPQLDRTNASILIDRYPHYLPQVHRFCGTLDGPLAAHAVRVESTGRLRVAMDLRHLPADPVGTSVHALGLARALADRRDVELTMVVRQPSQAAGIRGRLVCEEGRLDDVEVVHKPAQVFDLRDLELLFGTPAHAVISYLDLIAHRAQEVFPDQSLADRYRATSYLLLQAAQGICASSEDAKVEIATEYGIPEDEVSVTPLGVDRTMFRVRGADDRTLLRALGVSGRYYLSVATDFPHKNLRNLLEAHARLRALWPGGDAPALVMVGCKADVRQGVYRQLEAEPRPGVLHRMGVSPDELRALYHGAEAMVFPSVYEGFGLPIVEAMSAGTPVIAMPISSVPEVGGDAALYPDGSSARDLARAMLRVATERGLRDELVARGLARAEAFRWERTAALTVEVYRKAIRRPSERSLLARRHLLEVTLAWGRQFAPEVQPVGIRNAWRELDRAVRARARRELGRFRNRAWNQSA